MSRVGKQLITVPEKVTVETKNDLLTVVGPKGTLTQQAHPSVTVNVADGVATVTVKDPELKSDRSLWGTYASLLKSMVIGVTEGFEKRLEINGVGYTWQVSGKKVTVKAGYSHPVEVVMPESIEAKLDENVLVISGLDKQMVGEVAANIRKIRKPEPYKGKGIKYADEHIVRKAGKQAASGEK